MFRNIERISEDIFMNTDVFQNMAQIWLFKATQSTATFGYLDEIIPYYYIIVRGLPSIMLEIQFFG